MSCRKILLVLLLAAIVIPVAYAEEQKQEISIGVLVDLSGPLTTYGKDIANTLDIAREDINKYFEEKGLPYYVKFYVEDTRVDPKIALEKVQALYGKGIKLVIGPMGSGEVANIKDYVTANKIIIISPSSTAIPKMIGITKPEEKKYIFRFVGTDDLQTKAIARELADSNIKAVVITYIGNAWGKGLYEMIKPKLDSLGIEEKHIEYPDPPPADFSPYIATMETALKDFMKKYNRSEIAVLAFSYEEVATMLAQIDKDSPLLKVVWFGCDGTAMSRKIISEVCDKASKVGIYSTLFEWRGKSYERLKEEYKKRGFGERPYSYAMNAYDAAWVLALAYVETVNETGKYDPDVMAEKIPKVTVNYSEGKYGVYPVTGYIELNEWNDRAYGDYMIYYVTEKCEWADAGIWNHSKDKVEWYHKPTVVTTTPITTTTITTTTNVTATVTAATTTTTVTTMTTTTTPKKPTPGFEAIFAIAGLIAVAYILRRL